MLSQLVYVSARSASCDDAAIEKILESSIRNNGKIDITGVLMHSENKFLQVLEGPYSEIISCYDKIKLDTRHKNVVMLHLGKIDKRNFPSWQMGSKKVNVNELDYNTNINSEDRAEFKAIMNGERQESAKAINIITKFF